jgi:hypothetical protein
MVARNTFDDVFGNNNLCFDICEFNIYYEQNEKFYFCKSGMTYTIWSFDKKCPNIDRSLLINLLDRRMNALSQCPHLYTTIFNHYGYNVAESIYFIEQAIKYVKTDLTNPNLELLNVIYNLSENFMVSLTNV